MESPKENPALSQTSWVLGFIFRSGAEWSWNNSCWLGMAQKSQAQKSSLTETEVRSMLFISSLSPITTVAVFVWRKSPADIAVINLIKYALTFLFNLELSGKVGKLIKSEKDVSKLIDDFTYAMRYTLSVRHILFSLLPERSSDHSSLFKDSDSVIKELDDWLHEHKPESGLVGGLEKGVEAILFAQTGQIYDFATDAWIQYFEALSKIIGLQTDNIEPPEVDGLKPADALKAHLEVINNEIGKIISNRKQGIVKS